MPIRPSPTTRSLFPDSWRPTNLLRFHSPDVTELKAWGTLRTMESIIAMVCSVAARVLPVGAFITTTPRRLASARSMLSSPTPARAAALSLLAASRISASRGVPLRVIIPSTSATATRRSSRESPVRTSTLMSWSCLSISSPASEIVSVTRTLNMFIFPPRPRFSRLPR